MTTTISIGISLLVLAGGTFLLAKTKKYELGKFFKFMSYFIIIAGFINFGCAIAHTMMRCCGKEYHHGMMKHQDCNMGHDLHSKGCKGGTCIDKSDHWEERDSLGAGNVH